MNAYVLCIAAALMALAGFYCLIVSRNVFKLVLGADIVFKALVIFCAGLCGLDSGVSTRAIIVLSVVQGVVITAGVTLAVRFVRRTGTADIKAAKTCDD